MKPIDRREFLYVSSILTAGGAATLAFGCFARNVKESFDNYPELTKEWDPVFGPPVAHGKFYHGRHDFKGHKSNSEYGATSPGVDYDVPIGTPIVPTSNSLLRKLTTGSRGAKTIWLRDKEKRWYWSVYSHLSRYIIDNRYKKLLKGHDQRLIKRNEIIALSGSSGTPEPHLHLGLYHIDYPMMDREYVDPEKYGIDGGKLVFWDGKTDLDKKFYPRVEALERTIKDLEQELATWKEVNHDKEELRGNIKEHGRFLRDNNWIEILDSNHFDEIKKLLKRVTLEEKTFIPGTEPYSLMLKVLGYSAEEKQEIIQTLPFISPNLVSLYKEPIYKEGEFVNRTS